MLQITGGMVTYGRTVNLGDYNSKKVEYQIAFNVGEDDSYDQLLHTAGLLAWKHVGHLLDQKGAIPPVAARTELPKVETKAIEAPKAEAAPAAPPASDEPPKKPRGRPPGSKVAAPKVEAADDLGLDDEPVAPKVEAVDDLGLDDEPTEITDKDLNEAVKTHNAKVKNGAGIKKVMTDFTPKGQIVSIGAIPQERRAAFLEALHKVPAL